MELSMWENFKKIIKKTFPGALTKLSLKRWVKRNILDNQFAIENEDYIEVVDRWSTTTKGGKNNQKNFSRRATETSKT